jgi:hypothetical protein
MSAGQRCGIERRRHPRIAPSASSGPAMVRLRPGREAVVVNMSRGGACVEASAPLRPGTPVEIRVALSDWQWQGEARVLRCQVSALPRQEKVRYRAGLQFSGPVTTVGAPVEASL